MRKIFLVVMLFANPVVAAEQAIVCPSHLAYCYKKPVLQEKRIDDEIADIEARIRYYRARLDADHTRTIREIGRTR